MKWLSIAAVITLAAQAGDARGDTKKRRSDSSDSSDSEPGEDESFSKLPAIATTVLALAGGAFALYSHGKAHDAAEPVQFAANQDVYDEDAKGVRRWNAGIVVGASVAGFAAAVSGYLWYRALRSPRRVEISADGEGARVWLRGSF